MMMMMMVMATPGGIVGAKSKDRNWDTSPVLLSLEVQVEADETNQKEKKDSTPCL